MTLVTYLSPADLRSATRVPGGEAEERRREGGRGGSTPASRPSCPRTYTLHTLGPFCSPCCVMVRALTPHPSQATLRCMDAAAYEHITRTLRDGRRSASSPQNGAPTTERHDEPHTTGSAEWMRADVLWESRHSYAVRTISVRWSRLAW